MTKTIVNKTTKIEIRVTPQMKAEIERASKENCPRWRSPSVARYLLSLHADYMRTHPELKL